MGVLFDGLTSKLEHTTASGFDNVTCTILAWAYANGVGEGTVGRIFSCDETTLRPALSHQTVADKLRVFQSFSTTNGIWEFPATDNQWNAVGASYDAGSVSNDPVARVNFASATVTETQTPVGTRMAPTGTGYAIGNQNSQTQTWDGRLAHVQYFNVILSAAEMDAALRSPGSIRRGLVLWVPMLDASYVQDWSGNNNHPTATALAAAAGPPCGPLFNSAGWQGAFAAGGTLFTQAVSDTVSLSESLARTVIRAIAETAGFTEALTNQAQKQFLETVVLTEDQTVSAAKVFAETAALTEALVKQTQRAIAESVGLTENLSATVVKLKDIAETVSLTESLKIQSQKVFGEGVALSEDITIALTRSVAEAIVLTENLSRQVQRAIGDTLGLTEQLGVRVSGKTFTETVNLSEDLKKQISRTVAETVGLTESLQARVSRVLGLSETVTLTESLSATIVVIGAPIPIDIVELGDLFEWTEMGPSFEFVEMP